MTYLPAHITSVNVTVIGRLTLVPPAARELDSLYHASPPQGYVLQAPFQPYHYHAHLTPVTVPSGSALFFRHTLSYRKDTALRCVCVDSAANSKTSLTGQ